MKFRSRFTTTILLAAVLFLLTVYVAVIEVPQGEKAKKAEQTADRLFNFESGDVEAIRLRYPADEIELKKSEDGTWRLTQPIIAEADQREVQSLISTVADVRFTRVVEEQLSSPAEYGLEHPNVEITLTLPDRTERLSLGDDGPMAGGVYARRDGDPRLVLASQWIKGSLTRTVFDFRTKIILPIEHEKLDLVRLEFPKQGFLIEKQEKGWFLKNPVEGLADEDAMSTLALMLENLRATLFIDPGPEKEKLLKGFKKPLVVVTLRESGKDSGSSPAARFYDAPEKDSVYVVTEPDKPIYRVARANMDELKPDLFHYQDKRLIRIERDAIKRIEVRGPSEPFALSLGETDWTMEGETQPVRPDRVKRFLEQIEKLKAHQLPEKPVKNPGEAGLKPAIYEIRLADPSIQTAVALQLGNELKGMLYARGNTNLGVVMVNKDFLDEIPKKSELLKKEEPAKENKADTKK